VCKCVQSVQNVYFCSAATGDKSWKEVMSALVIRDHECDVMSLFTNSKLLQQLIGVGLHQSSHCQAMSSSFGADESIHGDELCNGDDFDDDNAESVHSSGTEAMEYEDIDRLMFSIDATVLGNCMIGPSINSINLFAQNKVSTVHSEYSIQLST